MSGLLVWPSVISGRKVLAGSQCVRNQRLLSPWRARALATMAAGQAESSRLM
ncbi:MAG: hypothetical protein M0008_09620 [Actinomycetota bacterium]|nr:hypothetical protein [Actinomycetota bacterium]